VKNGEMEPNGTRQREEVDSPKDDERGDWKDKMRR